MSCRVVSCRVVSCLVLSCLCTGKALNFGTGNMLLLRLPFDSPECLLPNKTRRLNETDLSLCCLLSSCLLYGLSLFLAWQSMGLFVVICGFAFISPVFFFVLSCLVLSCLVLSCRAVSCLVLSCRVVSCRVVPCCVVSCLVLFCLILSCLVVSCRVLSCRVLSLCLFR